jgi:hypothetical protein
MEEVGAGMEAIRQFPTFRTIGCSQLKISLSFEVDLTKRIFQVTANVNTPKLNGDFLG